MLKEISANVKPIPNHTRLPWARWHAYSYVRDPGTLYAEYLSRDVTFHQPICDDDDGFRGFEIQDANGCILFFGRPNTQSS